jgi:enamine deaminase RidA (YjgF/YER057c/UK114 family)
MSDAVSVNATFTDQGGVAPGQSFTVKGTNFFGRTQVCVRNLDQHNDASFTATSFTTVIQTTIVKPNSQNCSTLNRAWVANDVVVVNTSASAHIEVTKP